MIEIRESLTSGLESLRVHALRSGLAMLGIIFGVGAVIAMLSIGAGAEREALATIDAMGVSNVIVRAKDPERENERQEIRQKSLGLAQRDADAIRDAVPGVELVVTPHRGGAVEGALGHGARQAARPRRLGGLPEARQGSAGRGALLRRSATRRPSRRSASSARP